MEFLWDPQLASVSATRCCIAWTGRERGRKLQMFSQVFLFYWHFLFTIGQTAAVYRLTDRAQTHTHSNIATGYFPSSAGEFTKMLHTFGGCHISIWQIFPWQMDLGNAFAAFVPETTSTSSLKEFPQVSQWAWGEIIEICKQFYDNLQFPTRLWCEISNQCSNYINLSISWVNY